MQTVILAGGLGSRLGSLAAETGKPMALVAGRPFLELLVLQLARQGLRDLVMCVGHRAGRIREHFGGGDRLGVRIRYVEERQPLGTAGALRNASGAIHGDFLLSNGDSMVAFRAEELLRDHGATGATVTMTLAASDEAGRFGQVKLDEDGLVTAFVEKPERPTAGLVNAGVYACRFELLSRLPDRLPASLERDVFPDMVGTDLYGHVVDCSIVDIGTPEALDQARRDPTSILVMSGEMEGAPC